MEDISTGLPAKRNDDPFSQAQPSTPASRPFGYRGSDSWPLFATQVTRAGMTQADQGDLPVILLHGGGPDHHSLMPLARQLVDLHPVVLPDVRGYGQSVCPDPFRHTWRQYAHDVVALLDHIGAARAIIGGTGMGATISLRTALAYPERTAALVLISVEDIEDDQAKSAEIAFMEAFAARVRTEGLWAAWEPILPALSPLIGALVRDAIPRSEPSSIAAAAAIGHDRSFRNAEELAAIAVPALLIPGMDWRHPKGLAEKLARILPKGQLAPVPLSADLQTSDDFAHAFAPVIQRFFLHTLGEQSNHNKM